MKRFVAIAALVAAGACGSDSPSSPSSTLPTTVNFTAALNPANEVPPVTNADASGRGTANITLHLTRDGGGTITAASTDITFNLNGFPSGTSLILCHIHEGGPAVSGGAKVNCGLSAATAVVLANGTVSNQTYAGLTTDVTIAQQMIDNPNGYYFNVHTTINPSGAVRGQLVKQ